MRNIRLGGDETIRERLKRKRKIQHKGYGCVLIEYSTSLNPIIYLNIDNFYNNRFYFKPFNNHKDIITMNYSVYQQVPNLIQNLSAISGVIVPTVNASYTLPIRHANTRAYPTSRNGRILVLLLQTRLFLHSNNAKFWSKTLPARCRATAVHLLLQLSLLLVHLLALRRLRTHLLLTKLLLLLLTELLDKLALI